MDPQAIAARCFNGIGTFLGVCLRHWRITLLVILALLVWLKWDLVYATVITILSRLAVLGIIGMAFYLVFKPLIDPFRKKGKKDK
jgi:hypothetical protein